VSLKFNTTAVDLVETDGVEIVSGSWFYAFITHGGASKNDSGTLMQALLTDE